MFNLVFNEIVSDKETIEQLWNKYKSVINGKEEFDFNMFIPLPQQLSEIKHVSPQDDEMYYYLSDRFELNYEQVMSLPDTRFLKQFGIFNLGAYHYNAMREGIERRCELGCLIPVDLDGVYNRGKQVVQNYKDYGYPDWYDWSIDNWGTAWGAGDTYKGDEFISFITAYDPPEPIFELICENFPSAKIDFYADFEGFRAKIYFNNNGTLAIKAPEPTKQFKPKL